MVTRFGVLLLVLVVHTEAVYKRWVPNTNYENPDNWAHQRMPCPNDHVHIPEGMGPVYVQTNSTITEIILPQNGELVLGDWMSFSFPVAMDNNADCPGEDVEFTRMNAKSWLDPDNWCVAGSPEGSCMAHQPSGLDTEQLPCSYDDVVFPSGASFLVSLESGVDITVGSVTIAGKKHTSKSFQDFISSGTGKKQFVRKPGAGTTLTVRTPGCSDVTGCNCGNTKGGIYKSMCTHRVDKCPILACQAPLLPVGACCHTCGAMLDIDFGLGFKLETLRNMIDTYYARRTADGATVSAIVSKTAGGRIQVVLTDDRNGDAAVAAAIRLYNDLDKDMKGNRRYGVASMTIQQSGTGGAAADKLQTDSGGFMTGPSIAGVVIAIIIVIVLILLAMFCFMDRKSNRSCLSLPNAFKRFSDEETEEDKRNDLELGPSLSFTDITFHRSGSVGSERGFNNPMYDTPNAANGDYERRDSEGLNDLKEINANDATVEDVGFTNPLYGEASIKDLYADPSCSTIKVNPVYDAEGIEQDSKI